jgi:hypothetical protein
MLCKNPENILKNIENCPFVLHAFKLTGKINLMVLIAAPDIKTIDRMVDMCFRTHPDIMTLNVSFIISSVKDLILPVNFDIELFNEFGCGKNGCLVHAGEEDKLKKLIRESRQKALENDASNE